MLYKVFDHAGKQLDKKIKVNLEIYDVITWLTKNYCPISQEVKVIRQLNLVS